MKQRNINSINEYCYHVNVIVYAQRNGERKGRMKKVNEVSRLTGVSRRTLQYYDDEGLLMAERSKDNYRLYDAEAMERVWQILVYREMEIELKDIKYLFELPEKERKKFLQNLILDMRKQIDHLEDEIQFINYIKENGMPSLPEEEKGCKTYVDHISTLKTDLNAFKRRRR